MRFRRNIAVACAAILIQALPALADDLAVAEAIKAAKAELDTAFQNQDAATIERLVTADHRAATTYYGRVFTTADELATLLEFKATYFDFTDVKVTVLGPDAAMITFENLYKGTFQGRPLPERVFVSETWVKQDGTWRQQLYQETPIAP
jgi:hypothetical protein